MIYGVLSSQKHDFWAISGIKHILWEEDLNSEWLQQTPSNFWGFWTQVNQETYLTSKTAFPKISYLLQIIDTLHSFSFPSP